MSPHQHVFRIRRNYNRWVANQTLEDFALRFTAKSARKWSAARVSHTALGAISFLALEAIGGAITLNYGFVNTIAAVIAVGHIIFLTGIPISYHASKQGIDIDLLTRGAGFGYIGSTITSLIYASFTFIFFAIEAAIMALALELTLSIPLTIGYFISAIVVIPLVTHGITLISRFQVWTQPLWITLQLLPLACIALQYDDAYELWTNYTPIDSSSGFNLLAFGAASAVIFSLIAQIGEQVDFLRFLPEKNNASKKWWIALLSAGPGWIITGSIKILIGSFLAILALTHGVDAINAADPNYMYQTAFSYLGQSPQFTLFLTGVFVILSQLKINVTNAYAGSIAWSNFFSRLTHNHPGRVVWLVFNVAIALMLMELGIYRVLEEILSVYSIVAIAWVGSLVADLVINKPLKLRPQEIEFKRAHLYDINPVGVGSMLLASTIGFMAHFDQFGQLAQSLSSFLTLGCTFVFAPLIAIATKGKYYIARDPVSFKTKDKVLCCICEHHFDNEDMSYCPAYAGPICSLCCTLDSRCHDMCKKGSRFSEQLTAAFSIFLPKRYIPSLNSRMGHFIAFFVLTSAMMACLLLLVYIQITLDSSVDKTIVSNALYNIFFILLTVCGVLSWMFSLVNDSRRVAQEESMRQTELLVEEINAHKITDAELQAAKKVSDSANQAKSRYLTGISHELRSPLNAIMGYAQLLEKSSDIPETRKNALKIIRRSSEYLADLIEGLLDISRIEAGKLDLSSNEVEFVNTLDQIVNMFKLQAEDKGLKFEFQQLSPLPERVRTDEKRLRQILINILSNAIKYTPSGSVKFSVSYRSQVAEFSIIDTGLGIKKKDISRIFHPFERIRSPGDPHITGTGLGLTITRLLTDMMGGDISITSESGKGSHFKISLMLPSLNSSYSLKPIVNNIIGYKGSNKTLFIVDDEPTHRSFMHDCLSPLGFTILQAPDGTTCLDMLKFTEHEPDLFLLDIAMPGMSGYELAEILHHQYPSSKILMLSANAHIKETDEDAPPPYDSYLVKPLVINQLFEQIKKLIEIDWIFEKDEELTLLPKITSSFSNTEKDEMIKLANMGYAKGLLSLLDSIIAKKDIDQKLSLVLKDHIESFQFELFIKTLGTKQ